MTAKFSSALPIQKQVFETRTCSSDSPAAPVFGSPDRWPQAWHETFVRLSTPPGLATRPSLQHVAIDACVNHDRGFPNAVLKSLLIELHSAKSILGNGLFRPAAITEGDPTAPQNITPQLAGQALIVMWARQLAAEGDHRRMLSFAETPGLPVLSVAFGRYRALLQPGKSANSVLIQPAAWWPAALADGEAVCDAAEFLERCGRCGRALSSPA